MMVIMLTLYHMHCLCKVFDTALYYQLIYFHKFVAMDLKLFKHA